MRRRPLKKPMLNVVFARLSDFTILWQQLRLPWKQLKYPGPESWMEVVLVLAMTGVLGKASGFGSRPLVGWGLVVVEVGRGGGARGGIDAGSLGRRLLHDSWLWENWSQGKVGRGGGGGQVAELFVAVSVTVWPVATTTAPWDGRVLCRGPSCRLPKASRPARLTDQTMTN